MPTCCKTLSGFNIGSSVCCKQARRGGITDLLIACACNIQTVQVGTDDYISSITFTTDSNQKFQRYQFPVGGGQVDVTPSVSDTNYYVEWATTITINWPGFIATLRRELQNMAENNLAVIYADSNKETTDLYGRYWYVGPLWPQTSDEGYVNLNGGTITTGRSRADNNQAEPTLGNTASYLPYPVDDSIISGLITTTARSAASSK